MSLLRDMDRLIKKLYVLQDHDNDADILEILGTFKKWREVKTTDELEAIIKATSSVAMYISSLRTERDSLHTIIGELREEKNHYALRAKEAEQELKMLRDTKDPLAKMTK